MYHLKVIVVNLDDDVNLLFRQNFHKRFRDFFTMDKIIKSLDLFFSFDINLIFLLLQFSNKLLKKLINISILMWIFRSLCKAKIFYHWWLIWLYVKSYMIINANEFVYFSIMICLGKLLIWGFWCFWYMHVKPKNIWPIFDLGFYMYVICLYDVCEA